MYCTNCGQPRPYDAVSCPNCNVPVRRPNPLPGAPLQIPNYLVQSVLVTLCCCLPLGVVAIVNSAQVDSRLAAGDIAGAQRASKNAKMFAWLGVAGGIVTGFGYALIQFLGHAHS